MSTVLDGLGPLGGVGVRFVAAMTLVLGFIVVSTTSADAAQTQRLTGRLEITNIPGSECFPLDGMLHRPGPDLQFSSSACFVDIGSACAAGLEGSFTLARTNGSVSGSYEGFIACSTVFPSEWSLTFTIASGTGAYSNSTGDFYGQGCDAVGGAVLNISADESVRAPSTPCEVRVA